MTATVPQIDESGSSQRRDDLIRSLYRQYSGRLSRYLATRFSHATVEPEDIVQSTFLKLAGHEDLQQIADPRAYIFTRASKPPIERQRKSVHQRAHADAVQVPAPPESSSTPSSEKILIDRERLNSIEAALRKMPALRRRIFLLVRIEGQSVQDVADRFALSDAAVYKHVGRALRDCAKCLEKFDRKASYES